MKKAIVNLVYYLNTECPHCEEDVDLNENHDHELNESIFNNKWEDLEGVEVVCPECNKYFLIEKLEY